MQLEDEIKLDKKSFKALASDTRVSILKSLTRRRKTMTELSKELGMSVPTIKEHLSSLESAGLVKQIDDGHKWKYYELTRKGRGIAEPGQKSVWIVLAISVIGLSMTMFDFLRSRGAYTQTLTDTFAKGAAQEAGEALVAAPGAPEAISSAPIIPEFTLHLALGIVFTILLIVAIGFIAKKRIH